MTTSKPADFSPLPQTCTALSANEAAALYRLMTWLSPAFPVGAFSYSSGIEWAVEAGDIVDVTTLQDWLASMLADGPGFCDGVFLVHAHRAASGPDDASIARRRRTCRRLCALARAPSGNRGARSRLYRDRARGMELRWPRSPGRGLRRRNRLSARGRHRQRGACDPAGIDDARVSARSNVELDFRRLPGSFRSGKPTASARWRRWSRSWSRPGNARSARRWTISAARRSAPTSPACATRRNIRGCFGRDEQPCHIHTCHHPA